MLLKCGSHLSPVGSLHTDGFREHSHISVDFLCSLDGSDVRVVPPLRSGLKISQQLFDWLTNPDDFGDKSAVPLGI